MKTIKESATKYASVVYFTTENEAQELIEAFEKGVEFSQRWIPVEEELPEDNPDLFLRSARTTDVIAKRQWEDTGEIVIEINSRFRPSEIIGFLWNFDYPKSKIIEWRPIELK